MCNVHLLYCIIKIGENHSFVFRNAGNQILCTKSTNSQSVLSLVIRVEGWTARINNMVVVDMPIDTDQK